MANTFKTSADNLARIASMLVSKDLVVARTVNTDYSAEFAQRLGATVNARIPAALQASTMGLDGARTALPAAVVITESTQAITLTTNVFSNVALTDEDMSLRIEDFTKQVLAPQALAVAEGIENLVVAKLQSVTESAALDTAYTLGTPSTVLTLFLAARKALRDLSAPATGLYAVVGTGVFQDVLAYNASVGANGGNGDGMANTGVTRLGGFVVIESNRLAATEAIFYHRDAITLAMRAPVVPQGVTFGQSVSDNGVAMRWIRDYDYVNTSDRSLLNVYAGAALLNAQVSSTGTPVNFVLRVNDGAGT